LKDTALMARLSSGKIDKLTTPDLVLLSLLAERPMHGYAANVLLEQRMVRDWAGVSRPQVYYSLEKLSRMGLIRAGGKDGPSAGPERSVFATTAAGRAALADALEREDWTTQQERPAFLTWTALSWQAQPGVFLKQVGRRRTFLEKELKRKQEILGAVRKEVGHRFHEAVWMLSLNIEQNRAELRWLHKLIREFPRRASARNPNYVGEEKQ
jgi:DNA-binding PadR family transcriptional regulator